MGEQEAQATLGTRQTQGSRRADLVLEGGGVKGIGLLGAVVELTEQGWTFPRVAGVSAGAIVGALVAAYTHRGKDVGKLVEIMRSLDYEKFRDPGLLSRFGMPGKGLELLFHDGIYRGDYALHWLEAELEKVDVRTFADLRIDDDPDTALLDHERYRLVVCASDVSRGQFVRLPWDCDQHYDLRPAEMPVALAVRASMSYPFFFRPVPMTCGPMIGGSVTLIDGGMLSNFPVEIFDRGDARPSRWPTFGVKLSARPGAWRAEQPVDGPIELAFACLRTLIDAHDAYHLAEIHTTERTIFVDTEKVSTLDFGISQETQQTLYLNGRAAAQRFLRSRPAVRPAVEPAVIPAPAGAPAAQAPPETAG